MDIKRDRLSSLPDQLVIKILTFLPINSAVATSILSPRWRFLWKNLTAIRLKGSYNSFSQLLSNAGHVLRKLTFDAFYFDHIGSINEDPTTISFFNNLINMFIRPYLKEIKVKSCFCKALSLPSVVFQSCTLEVLHLDACFKFTLPKHGIKLPCLRKLCLFQIRKCHVEFLGKVVESCPILEILCVHGDFDFQDGEIISSKLMIINAQNLKCLDLHLVTRNYNLRHQARIHKTKVKILIDTPKLQQLIIGGSGLLRYSFSKTPIFLNKVEVNLRRVSYDPECKDEIVTQGILKLIRPLFRVKSLTFCDVVVDYLRNLEDERVPIFDGLKKLKLELVLPNCWKGFKTLVAFCPNLQELELKRSGTWKDMNNYELGSLPTSSLAKTKRITLLNFGIHYEIELRIIAWILYFAKFVKNVDVCFDEFSKEKYDVMEVADLVGFCHQLHKLETKWPNSQINFIYSSE